MFPGMVTQKFYNLQVSILGGWKYPGIITWKFDNLRVMIPGSVTISGYGYLEVNSLTPTNQDVVRSA